MNRKVSLSRDRRRRTSQWIVRWFSEPDTVTLKQKWYSRAFRLKVDAEKFQAQKNLEVTMNIPQKRVEPGTIHTFCKQWLKIKKRAWSPANLELYQLTVRRLENFFGKNRKISQITTHHAEVFLFEQKSWAQHNKNQQVELSEWSVHQLYRQCKAIFEGARKRGHIQTNPFDGISLAKPIVQKWHQITPQEYHQLLQVAPDLRWQVFYALAYTCALRLGELTALTWDAIDFEKNMVVIENRQATSNTPPFRIKDHDPRKIPLVDHTIQILTRWQSIAPEIPYILMTAERYVLVKAKWHELRKAKKPWRNSYMSNNILRNFKKHCKKAGIKARGKLSVHTLRKSCAQNWADTLPVGVTRQLMGHSKVETTLKFYNQVDDLHRQQASEKIQELLMAPIRPKPQR